MEELRFFETVIANYAFLRDEAICLILKIETKIIKIIMLHFIALVMT